MGTHDVRMIVLSTDDLERTERFAALVVHEGAGAAIVEIDPPVR